MPEEPTPPSRRPTHRPTRRLTDETAHPRRYWPERAGGSAGRAAAGFASPVEEGGDPDGWEIADLVAVGVLDAVTGQPPVPISVWRATGPHEAATTPDALYAGLTPRVAAILLATYTDPHDLVLDATQDPAVAGAAGAGGRRYRHLRTDTEAGPSNRAALVLVRWPVPSDAPPEPPVPVPVDLKDPGEGLLRLCFRSLTAEGHTVAILAPPVGGIYRDHARSLIAAARDAGLGYLQHIVVITNTGDRDDPIDDQADDDQINDDQINDQAPTEPGTLNCDPADPVAQVARREHLDLLVLILRPAPDPPNASSANLPAADLVDFARPADRGDHGHEPDGRRVA